MIYNIDYVHDTQLLRKVSSCSYNGYWLSTDLDKTCFNIYDHTHHQKTIDCNSETDFREIIIR